MRPHTCPPCLPPTETSLPGLDSWAEDTFKFRPHTCSLNTVSQGRPEFLGSGYGAGGGAYCLGEHTCSNASLASV